MVQYHFVTQWFFPASIERVWQEISDREHWSDWLQDFRRITLIAPVTNGETAFDIEYRGNLPYTFRFTLTPIVVDPPHCMELSASGQLVGRGCWTLVEQDGGTLVTYVWEVGVPNPIFSWIARLPGIKALTEWNHHATMRRAERALQQRLTEPNCDTAS